MSIARDHLWFLLTLPLLACSKPAPSECPAWDPASTPEREVCGDDSLVHRIASSGCNTGCAGDADCDDGTLCACGVGDDEGSCEPTGCRTAADCEDGFECIAHIETECGAQGVPVFGFHCQTADDDCALDADCAEGQFCRFVPAESIHRCFDPEAFSCG